jgi:hypothetical protein
MVLATHKLREMLCKVLEGGFLSLKMIWETLSFGLTLSFCLLI